MPSGSLGSSPWNFNVVPLPSNRTVINSLSLQAQYQWDPTTSIVLGYQYEQLDSLDYVNDQTATSPFYANAILGADGSPNYEVSIGTVAYRVKF